MIWFNLHTVCLNQWISKFFSCCKRYMISFSLWDCVFITAYQFFDEMICSRNDCYGCIWIFYYDSSNCAASLQILKSMSWVMPLGFLIHWHHDCKQTPKSFLCRDKGKEIGKKKRFANTSLSLSLFLLPASFLSLSSLLSLCREGKGGEGKGKRREKLVRRIFCPWTSQLLIYTYKQIATFVFVYWF